MWSIVCALSILFISVSSVPLRGRIIGGAEAAPDQFPYQVSIWKNGNQHCGGSILDAYHVITAAHCVHRNGIEYSPEILTIKAGHVDLASNKISEFPVNAIFSHEKYNKKNFENDIAILKVGVPFHIEEGVLEPIVLDRTEPDAGTKCLVSGWGTQRQNTTEMPTKLLFTDVKIRARKLCKKAYQLYNTVTTKMICAGFDQAKKDACEGDSGGPLACNGKLSGIVSWAVGCGLPEYPGVYTNIAKYVDWIKRIIH